MIRPSLTLAAACVLAACSDPLAPSPDGSSVAAPRNASPGYDVSPSRPAGGTCTFRSTLLPPEPGQPANVFHRQLDERCELQHLGRTIGSVEETATLTQNGPLITNTATYTAANGDQLFVAFSGTGTFPVDGVISFSGTETVTGGTGRFDGATGSLHRAGTVAIATQTGEFATSGSLSY